MSGFVSIVGAGPWDPALITLAGRERLRRAEVVVADYLVNPALLLHCPPQAQVFQRIRGPVATVLKQDKINALLVEHASAGRYVVRLKGGDPCMFGRGAEEAQVLRDAGIDYEFIPGVTSPVAAPQAAGIPVTHRDHTPAVTFVSGFEAYEKAGVAVAWEHLAKSAGTIVLMMSINNARMNAQRLIDAGRNPQTPAAAVRWGTRGIQTTLVGTLSDIADRIDATKLRAPAVLVVGDVVRLREQLAWKEQRPLFGRRVVITRTLEQSESLAGMLAAAGADVTPFPCLKLMPPQDVNALDQAVGQIAKHDGVIVSSKHGVDALFAAMDRCGFDNRALAGKTVAAVGRATAAACARHGIRADVVPEIARAEGLVAALADRSLLKGSWLHVRAEEGRGVMGPAITDAGGQYVLAVGYRAVRPELPPMLVQSLRPPKDGGEGFDAICFASGKTVRHFLDLVGEAEARQMLERAKIVSIGPVTTSACESLGLKVAVTATAPTDAQIVQALHSALGTSS